MNLLFEKSNGKFKSNSNILALAWMPYSNEAKFRQAIFEYHQQQLINLASSRAVNGENSSASNLQGPSANDGPSEPHRGELAARLEEQSNQQRNRRERRSSTKDDAPNNDFYTIRLAELYNRYILLNPKIKAADQILLKKPTPQGLTYEDAQKISAELDRSYGRMPDFGWLVIGNIGQLIGITLTSVVDPPNENPIGASGDLIRFGDNEVDRACSEENEIMGSKAPQVDRLDFDYDNLRPDRKCVRDNYNLRGHLDEVTMVKWNELYQKLATVDLKGNVLIWCKVNEKFVIQTPFYNRTKSVADFQWSNDGKTALICYTDSFILVGSSSGQRHWHSMLNLDDYHITCASWTPDDSQLLLGVSNGNIVIIDLPHSDLTELVINQTNIRSMAWSSTELTFESVARWSTFERTLTDREQSLSYVPIPSKTSSMRTFGSTIVNHRPLPRDCSLLFRFGLGSSQNNPSPNLTQQSRRTTSAHSRGSQAKHCQLLANSHYQSTLAVDFADNTIELFTGGLSDSAPKRIDVRLESYVMQWSSNGRILAVAGFTINTTAPSVGLLRCRYLNTLKFYSQSGQLIHERCLRCTRYPITAFTWAHNDSRIFLATGPRLHCAKVYFGVQKLSSLAMNVFQRHTKLADKYDNISAIARSQFGFNLHEWQSANCPIELHAKQNGSSWSSSLSNSCDGLGLQPLTTGSERSYQHNSNAYKHSLPLKLLRQIDQLCSTTLKQPFDESWSLSDIVWHVPKNGKRIFCTLVCYTSERGLDVAPTLQSRASRSQRLAEEGSTSDQNKIFVLYVEFQGSFLPILRARRVGYLKPEFVIFDPDESAALACPRKCTKVSDISASPAFKSSPYKAHNHSSMRHFDLHQSNSCSSSDCIKTSSRNRPARRSDKLSRPVKNDSSELIKSNQSKSFYQDGFRLATSAVQFGRDFPLGERDELVRVKSNIWGTKFKIINTSNRMIRQRSLLGSVEYRASILHLQPRQIFLAIKDMSNYCCLCSKHHHSRASNSKTSAQTIQNGSTDQSKKLMNHSAQASLLDMPINFEQTTPNSISNPIADFSPRRSARSRERLHKPNYPTKGSGGCLSASLDRIAGKELRLIRNEKSFPMVQSQATSSGEDSIRNASRSDLQPADDIMTISFGQHEPVKVELSCGRRPSKQRSSRFDLGEKKVEEILAANKTLKSIQSITQMIVDLSSKSEDESDSVSGSPSKLVKISHDDQRKTNALPDTPVHRPKRPTPNSVQLGFAGRSQSVSTTPVRQKSLEGKQSQRTGSRAGNRKSEWKSSERSRSKSQWIEERLQIEQSSANFSRRLSSSAKRLFDGSLRSLSRLNSFSGSETDNEDSEPLVVRRGPQIRRQKSDLAFGLSSLRSQVTDRLSRSQAPARAPKSSMDKARASSSGRVEMNLPMNLKEREKLVEYESDANELTDCASSSDESSSSELDFAQAQTYEQRPIDRAMRNSYGSARDVRLDKQTKLKNEIKGRTQGNRKNRLRRNSICSRTSCCCAREFKLNNRAPLWNDLNQVYQLDFGGRVTQESAKNLQIDFDGNLALQFGRIDNSTYTLDYKYPFNAVQATSIALASLTQRLK